MPPHCDSLDGPVVAAARDALKRREADRALPFVPEAAEGEVTRALELALAVRAAGGDAQELADRWFLETVVRLHRIGEGAPYTGLKPAGGHGPVVPLAERAVETGSTRELQALLADSLAEELRLRLDNVELLRRRSDGDVAANREYVEALLGFEVWAHSVYERIRAPLHVHGDLHVHA
ncbi:MAG TPA: DUF6448 family protein [Gaiellaceae bacterium]|nr:DUF6448 family protein [Gaiellaceae bacterium]